MRDILAEVFKPAPGDPLSCKVYFKLASANLPVISSNPKELE